MEALTNIFARGRPGRLRRANRTGQTADRRRSGPPQASPRHESPGAVAYRQSHTHLRVVAGVENATRR